MSCKIDETTNSEIVFYSIKDKSLGFFAFPFTARSDREAMAMVRNACEVGSSLHRFPDHYAIYKVGVFDDRKGEFFALPPLLICEVDVLVATIPEEEGVIDDAST